MSIVSRSRAAGLDLSPTVLFEHATIAGLAAVAGAVTGGRGERDTRPFAHSDLNRDDLARVTARWADGPAEVIDAYPLSPLQAGMLFHSVAEEDADTYFRQFTMDVPGRLDVEALHRAWQRAVDRHPALRTTFAWADVDHPQQLIHRRTEVPFEVVGLEAVPPAGREERFRELVAEEGRRGIDLTAGVQRLVLVRLGRDEHRLIWNVHHLAVDGWSAAVVLREVASFYRTADDSALPDPVPYARYLNWLAARDRADDERYWTGELSGMERPTPIWSTSPRSRSGATVERAEVDTDLVAGLTALCRRHRVTLGTVLQAAWALVLHRYSGDRDVVFGLTALGRPPEIPGMESLVGMFINTVPLRITVDDRASVGEWLRDVQRRQVRTREHEHCALVDVRRHSGVPAGDPLFHSVFVFDHFAAADDDEQDGLRFVPRPGETVPRTGVPLVVEPSLGRDLVVRIYAEREYVDDFVVAGLLRHYLQVLRSLADGPEAVLGELAMLPDDEYARVVRGWNDTAEDYGNNRTLGELFEDRAHRDPAGVAVVDTDGREVSFGELNERVNRLATHLRGLGVGPETFTGVCVEQSVDMLVALLGVVKAGGAYVPLDASHPAERLAFVLADTGASVVVTSRAQAAAVPDGFTGRRVLIDGDWPRIARCPAGDPPRLAVPDNLVYAMYTSGSTGRPKGVMISHRALNNYLLWAVDGYGLGGRKGAPMLGSIAYDLSVPNFLLPLIGGKSVTLLPPDDHGLEHLAGLLATPDDFSLLKITPGHLDVLRSQMAEGSVTSVRTFVVGADEVRPETMAGWRRVAPGARLIDEYGPTETVVGCSTYVIPDDFDPAVSVSIGRPIGNMQMYVLDSVLRPVPAGVVGELYIGGDGVARGYLGRPGLTADRFLPDPFSPHPGRRFYRTGDLARLAPDGTIDFLGRIDHQVKIRGYRVELGEVEARLLVHPQVCEAVVTARGGGADGRRLAGYVVPVDGAPVTAAELRDHVAAALPDYMVPATIDVLAAMPLTAAGKVHRDALPDPGSPAIAVAGTGEEPATSTERTLAEIWAKVLGADRVGVRDGFFALGGDSILSLQVVNLARKAGLTITPRQVLTLETVRELAAQVDAGCREELPVPQERVTGESPLTPIQRWFLDQDGPHHHYNQAHLLRWSGRTDPDRLNRALTALVAHHDALRLRLTPDGRLTHAAEDTADQWRIDLTDVPAARRGAEREAVADRMQATFDLTTGPLLRVAVFTAADETDDLVLLVVHHLVMDAVSFGILLDDLATAYRRAGLPAKTTAFRDWAHRLAEYARSNGFAEDLAYWRLPADHAPLPVDDPGAENTIGASRVLVGELDAEVTGALLRRVPAVYRAQVDDVLLTGLARTIAEWTGRAGVRIGLEGHGREALFDDVDLSRTIGWFTSLYPVTLELPAGPGGHGTASHGACLNAVKEQLRVLPHHGIGYGVARHLAGADLPGGEPEVLFNYSGQVDRYRQDAAGGTVFTVLEESLGSPRDPARQRTALLEFEAGVAGGRFAVSLRYGKHSTATARYILDSFLANLTALAEHCADMAPGQPLRPLTDHLVARTPALRLTMDRNRVPGTSVAVLADGRITDSWSEGVLDIATGQPMTPHTRFQAGSVTKQVVALGVLALVRDGVLDLDTAVGQYLRTWRLPGAAAFAEPVTLRRLLGHAAGLAHTTNPGYPLESPEPTVRDILDGRPPAVTPPVRVDRRPGSDYRYAGNNYLVIQQLLEDVTRAPFAGLMRDLVLEPLGMRHSRFTAPERDDDTVASGHDRRGVPLPGRWHGYSGSAAAGLWTTAEDLAAVVADIQRAAGGADAKVLTADLAGQMLTPVVPRSGYGLGAFLTGGRGGAGFGHGGDADGFRCFLMGSLVDTSGFVLMTNADAGNVLIDDLLMRIGVDALEEVDQFEPALERRRRLG
jgi:amino acid adenylation domain-containing protein/non-ribosomal peptide synthase protein (TIGR01720 family)